MKINKLNSIILLGLIAIISILVAQLLWTKEAFTLEQKKLSQKANIALFEVARKLYNGKDHEPSCQNPVRKISNDYYIVNIENAFESDILEFYLRSEFKKMHITSDFEYAVYNCQSDEMVYGKYISSSEKGKDKKLRFILNSTNTQKTQNKIFSSFFLFQVQSQNTASSF